MYAAHCAILLYINTAQLWQGRVEHSLGCEWSGDQETDILPSGRWYGLSNSLGKLQYKFNPMYY